MSSSSETPTTTPGSILNPSLPDDLTLSCISRLSRLYYPTLSLVSKRFPFLLTSPELYKSRSLLNRTESCLYVCLRFHGDNPNPRRWFTLCRKPNNGNLLIPISTLQSPPPSQWSEFVAVGSNIYSIGGTNGISILDCTSHTWHEASRRRYERLDFNPSSACVIDQNVYIVGGDDSIDVFNSKTQVWDIVSCPQINTDRCNSVCIEGKFHLLSDRKGWAYDPEIGKWDLVEEEMMDKNWEWVPYCVIENVFYCYYGELLWYDTKVRSWKSVKGLVELPVFPDYRYPKLVDYGGKMMVLWVEHLFDDDVNKTMISCAEIAIEKREGDEIWGETEWIDSVLTVSQPCNVLEVLAVTL